MKHSLARVVVKLCFTLPTLALSGCLIPVPAPERTSAPPEIKKIDLSFLHAGTPREEVQKKLGWSDTGITVQKVFVGRWSKSSSATIWAIGGLGGAAAGGDRNWGTKTIIVRFDDKNSVSDWKIMPDRQVVAELRAIARAGESQVPLELQLLHWHFKAEARHAVTVELRDRRLRFSEGDGRVVEIDQSKIVGFSIPKLMKTEEQIPQELKFTMHLSEKTIAGKNLTFQGDLSELMTLIEFQLQSGPMPSK